VDDRVSASTTALYLYLILATVAALLFGALLLIVVVVCKLRRKLRPTSPSSSPRFADLNTIRQRFFRVLFLKDLFDSIDTHKPI